MRIMPSSGNDIGFSSDGWASVRRSVRAQAEDGGKTFQEQALDALCAAPLKDTRFGEVEWDDTSEMVASPGSPWGGREVDTGRAYWVGMDGTLEASVPRPAGETDEGIRQEAAMLAKEMELEWIVGADEVKQELGAQIWSYGPVEFEYGFSLKSIVVGPDKVEMVVCVHVEARSHESPSDMRARQDDYRADRD